LITARTCFETGGEPVVLGPPKTSAVATVGRQDLTTTTGHVSPIVRLVPHPERNVVLARLATPISDIAPVRIGSAAPAVGDLLRLAGYGRTATEWVPDQAHAGSFRVTAVTASTVDVVGETADQVGPCKGDAGGPALREAAGGAELVAVGHSSWQHGCLGEVETRRGAVETRVDDIREWIRLAVADVSVFGVRSDGRLTFSGIDSATGDHAGTVVSGSPLPFPVRALATLNFNTLVAGSTANVLYRIDIVSTNPLVYAAPVQIATGFAADRLTYDGDGSLYGIAGSELHRYTVPSAKPTRLTNDTTIGSGFGSLLWLAATGPDFLLATTSAGRLITYRIVNNTWVRTDLAASGWNHPQVISPGGGLYYARTSSGGLLRFLDADPFNGSGTDIQPFPNDPVDTSGWNQTLLSAQPFIA
jgi:hypothetical protein